MFSEGPDKRRDSNHLQFEECAALQVALDAKIADHLEDHADGLHVREIGKRSGLDSDKLGRVLRLLATKHVFREGKNINNSVSFSISLTFVFTWIVKPNVFANNRLSVKLLSSDTNSDFVSHK